MNLSDIAAARLENQRIARAIARRPTDVVAWLGAVQAGSGAARWALGLRLEDATEETIERALNDGRILRTHVMRPTWHLVAASDIGWMLELTAPRVHRAVASSCRQFGVDAATCVRTARVFERALADGGYLTRAELGARLARGGRSPMKGIPLALLTIYAELEGVLCSGPRRGGQTTYTLLASRVNKTTRLSRDEALSELATRYFRSHGPATIRDFAWWSGLTMADAARGADISRCQRVDIGGFVSWTHSALPALPSRRRRRSDHLLPIYDEYIVAYRDHDAVPRALTPRGGLDPAVVVDGRIAGTWSASSRAGTLVVDIAVSGPLDESRRRGIEKAAARYGRFREASVAVRRVSAVARR